MKTPSQLPGRAFSLTVTGDKVRQIDFGSPIRTSFKRWIKHKICARPQPQSGLPIPPVANDMSVRKSYRSTSLSGRQAI